MDDTDKGGRPNIGPKVSINFPTEQLAKVDELARETDTTRAAWIRQAVDDAIQREEAAARLRITVSDVRKLLDSGSEQPVLYINTEDGPAHIDDWAGAYVAHHWRIATRDEITDRIGDDPTDSEIRSILGDLQDTVNEIEL
ncbi:ribbon-helix-helix protein, CopG family [Streptomyces goshikiensis]|uniref:ribbon-helix-helix protein, CopG family n=1 Tax=Streptomyces goshikiensis TaxID=1942 RepID=UPI00369EAE20